MSDLSYVPATTRHALPSRRAVLGACATVMIAMALPLFWSFSSRSFHFLLESYNEGWNALFIDRVINGGALYPGPDELLLNNYPPLSFLIVAAVSKLVGNPIDAGRLVSAASFLVASGLIGCIVGSRTNRVAGLFAGSFFAVSFACFPGQRIGLNDPQLLAHALMLGGLACVWLWPDRVGAVVCGAALMVLAGMTKHNLIAIPLATTLWMLWRGRRAALLWLVSSGVSAGVGFAWMFGIGGMPMIESILAPRHMSLANSLAQSRKLLALIELPLVASALGLVSTRIRSDQVFALLLLGAALLEMLLFAGGDGVMANVAYDLLVAQGIAIGLAVASVRQPMLIVVAVLVHLCIVFPIGQVKQTLAGEPERAGRERLVQADIAYLKAHPGPALCYDPSLCWYAWRTLEFDSFNMGQQFSLGLRSSDGLKRRFAEKEFAVVELSGEGLGGPSLGLPKPVWDTLMANYRLDRTSEDRLFYLPNR